MVILQIEHQVPSYETWRKAFDSDPFDRKKTGVKNVRIYVSTEDPNHVIVDVAFESIEEAKSTLVELQKLWGKITGVVSSVPKTRFMFMVDEVNV